jgi:hypothetical protein
MFSYFVVSGTVVAEAYCGLFWLLEECGSHDDDDLE